MSPASGFRTARSFTLACRAIRAGSCARPGSPTSSPRRSWVMSGPPTTSTWWRWRRSPTSSPSAARTGRSSAPGSRRRARARRPGLRALCAAAGVRPERLDEGDLAFRLGPRINAAGRLYRADAGVELMLTADDQQGGLDRRSSSTASTASAVTPSGWCSASAERARAALPAELASAPGLVLAGEDWHPGVVGIVASRLAERHWAPVVLIGIDGDGRGRGSGRSVPGFDLLAALDACGEHLLRYGGHRAAAGLEIEAARVEDFRTAFVAHARAALGERDFVRTEVIDAVVGGESLGHERRRAARALAPFGMRQPRRAPAGALGAGVRGAADGRRGQARSLPARERLPQRPRGRVRGQRRAGGRPSSPTRSMSP